MSTSGDEPWLFATGTHHGAPMFCRLRTRPPTDEERAEYPLLVMIRWAFEPGDDQMPDEETLETMGEFEAALHASMESQGWGAILTVLTTGGVREWRAYTQDFDRFQQGLNDALMGQPPYPLTFETFEDAEWQAYGEIASAMVPRGQA